ncbi:hypothetical protein FQN60_011589 [Etheostoma spectabile]|uniref:Uncharacterized protein n=1 Tax=Etheostoma spectabile TaxID=54343 RepID=A0A5J5DM53_9PERO|nr:hypothetical protein FQN60_011589 [Etheostoma spectabile]
MSDTEESSAAAAGLAQQPAVKTRRWSSWPGSELSMINRCPKILVMYTSCCTDRSMLLALRRLSLCNGDLANGRHASLSKFGRMFRPIMMSSNSFSICSSHSSAGPGGWASGTDSGPLFWFGVKQSLERGWETDVVLKWGGGEGGSEESVRDPKLVGRRQHVILLSTSFYLQLPRVQESNKLQQGLGLHSLELDLALLT